MLRDLVIFYPADKNWMMVVFRIFFGVVGEGAICVYLCEPFQTACDCPNLLSLVSNVSYDRLNNASVV